MATMEKKKLKDLRKDIEILEGTINHTENISTLSVFNVEILRQSSTGKYGLNETMFGWHIYNEERKVQVKVAAIILLSDTTSSIQIMTKSNYKYSAQGTDIAFPSYLYHRSVQLEEKTMNLCFFLKDTDNIIDHDSIGRTTHNMRV